MQCSFPHTWTSTLATKACVSTAGAQRCHRSRIQRSVAGSSHADLQHSRLTQACGSAPAATGALHRPRELLRNVARIQRGSLQVQAMGEQP